MKRKPVKPRFVPQAGKYKAAQTVAITSPVTGATFYYTIDGSRPSRRSARYTVPIPVNATETIRAIAADGARNSPEAKGKFVIESPTANSPTFSLASGPYVGAQNVMLSTTSANATIYYTTDGSTPTTSSTQYAGAIAVNSSMTIKAVAGGTGYKTSPIAAASYVIQPQPAAAPTFSPSAGTYGTPQTVTLTTASGGATIYYTTDGSAPTTSSTQYTGPILVGATRAIQAIAGGTGFANSLVSSAVFTIQPAAVAPVLSPSPGNYSIGQSVTISTTSSGATIYYTADGSQPTINSTQYSGPILVNATTNLQAIAAGGAFASSSVSGGIYTIPPVSFVDHATADAAAFQNAINRVNQLLTAFKKRASLSGDEQGQLRDALELLTEYLNQNTTVPAPVFDSAALSSLGITFNTGPGVTRDNSGTATFGTGSGRANVIEDSFRAVRDFLFGVLYGSSGRRNPVVEHQGGVFPTQPGSTNPGGLSNDEMRMIAVYGIVKKAQTAAPPYKTLRFPILYSGDLFNTPVTADDNNRRDLFNQAVSTADGTYRSNIPLYTAALARLLSIGNTPQIASQDWANVVDILVGQGIDVNNPQLNVWIDRALATAQNVGQAPQPSQINIDLPDLEQDVSNFEIISGNIFALQPAYFCAMLEELKVFQVTEKLVELFQNGILPVVRGTGGNLLFAWWKNAALRVSETERRGFYARSLGFPGGDADSPNREFKDLFMHFVSAVSSWIRQQTVDNLLRSNIPAPISQQQVRKSARDLATNISAHGYGIAYPMATELQKEINDVMDILKNDEIRNAYGAKDMWQLVDQVAGLELGGAKNSVKYRTMASAGATVFAWLANKATDLASTSYLPILDVAQLQNPPSYTTKPTTKPSDYDLVGACDQWLAVTGTQEESVEQAAQPVEAAAMPSRPIQIPSVARDMLESVGVPALAYAGGQGKTNGSAYKNWRTS